MFLKLFKIFPFNLKIYYNKKFLPKLKSFEIILFMNFRDIR